MALKYIRPKLKSLSQGDRIAFVRQFRRMTQQELGERIGLKCKTKRVRNMICRTET